MLVNEYLLSIPNINNENMIILHKLYNNNNILGNLICNENFYNDIHIFNNNNIYEKINNNESDLGSINLQYKLCKPINNVEELRKNQKILNNFMLKKYDFSIINKNLYNILWFYKKRTDEENVLLNNLNFKNKYLKFITNKYQFMLLYYGYRYYVSPVFVIVYPLLMIIIPFLLLRIMFKMKLKMNLFLEIAKKMYLPKLNKNGGIKAKLSFIGSILFSLYGYINGIYSEYKIIKGINNTIKLLHNHLQSILNVINYYKELVKNNMLDNLREVNLKVFNFLSKKSLENNDNYFSNKAYIYHSYKRFIRIKKEFINVLYNIGEIECYYSISKKINNNNYSYTNYIENTKTPYIQFNEMWHPLIKKNIKNDIKQGGKNKKSYIITGPNGGGKSTYLRSIGINILFSQTFGFSFAKSGFLTPYSHVDTYMYIPDKEGYESLFQAEVNRCKKIIDNIDNKFYYLIVDEIFNSTNPIEGISSSYSFIELLNSYKNILGIYSTHFGYITKLGDKINNIGNIKVIVNRENKKIKFPYKIIDGISNDYIALELLKEKGFDNSFINNAIEIKEKLNSEFKL